MKNKVTFFTKIAIILISPFIIGGLVFSTLKPFEIEVQEEQIKTSICRLNKHYLNNTELEEIQIDTTYTQKLQFGVLQAIINLSDESAAKQLRDSVQSRAITKSQTVNKENLPLIATTIFNLCEQGELEAVNQENSASYKINIFRRSDNETKKIFDQYLQSLFPEIIILLNTGHYFITDITLETMPTANTIIGKISFSVDKMVIQGRISSPDVNEIMDLIGKPTLNGRVDVTNLKFELDFGYSEDTNFLPVELLNNVFFSEAVL